MPIPRLFFQFLALAVTPQRRCVFARWCGHLFCVLERCHPLRASIVAMHLAIPIPAPSMAGPNESENRTGVPGLAAGRSSVRNEDRNVDKSTLYVTF